MPDNAQFDLFAAPHVVEAVPIFVPSIEVGKMNMAAALPSKSWQWDMLLTRLPGSARLMIHVSALWTQVVVEQLVDPTMGRRLLWHNGNITEYPAPPAARAYRVIYMTGETAQALHQRMPLIEIERDETYVRLRPAEPGEVGPGMLEFPTIARKEDSGNDRSTHG